MITMEGKDYKCIFESSLTWKVCIIVRFKAYSIFIYVLTQKNKSLEKIKIVDNEYFQ